MSATKPIEPDLNPHLTRWITSPENAAWLRKIVTSERGKLLMGVLEEMAMPQEDFHSIDAINTETTAKLAYRQCLSSGQTLCIRNIRLLAVPVEPVKELDHGGWQDPERTAPEPLS